MATKIISKPSLTATCSNAKCKAQFAYEDEDVKETAAEEYPRGVGSLREHRQTVERPAYHAAVVIGTFYA
jgi:hypothetical protein